MPLVQVHLPLSILLSLLAILLAACAIFWLLVRRWTTQQHWLALSDWAEANGFTLRGEARAVSLDALNLLTQQRTPPRVLISLHDPDTAILQIETASPAAGASSPARWNLLIRKLATPWPITYLRPTAHVNSALDLLPLNTMHAMIPGERFVLYSQRNSLARLLNQSPIRALLPSDIGLALAEENLILDFSTRPFDALELQRMDALAEQLITRLPPLPRTSSNRSQE